jgi:hypothetical protein
MIAIFVLLLILWLLGVITGNTFEGLIHLLLVIGLVGLLLDAVNTGGRGRRWGFSLNNNLGLALAGIWFILTGLFTLVGFTFQGQAVVMAVVALIAGILLLIGR